MPSELSNWPGSFCDSSCDHPLPTPQDVLDRGVSADLHARQGGVRIGQGGVQARSSHPYGVESNSSGPWDRRKEWTGGCPFPIRYRCFQGAAQVRQGGVRQGVDGAPSAAKRTEATGCPREGPTVPSGPVCLTQVLRRGSGKVPYPGETPNGRYACRSSRSGEAPYVPFGVDHCPRSAVSSAREGGPPRPATGSWHGAHPLALRKEVRPGRGALPYSTAFDFAAPSAMFLLSWMPPPPLGGDFLRLRNSNTATATATAATTTPIRR